jgi:hypothetical protein
MEMNEALPHSQILVKELTRQSTLNASMGRGERVFGVFESLHDDKAAGRLSSASPNGLLRGDSLR